MFKKDSQQPLLPMLFSDSVRKTKTDKVTDMPPTPQTVTQAYLENKARAKHPKKNVTNNQKLPSYLKGHRKRLNEKFEDIGPEAFADYELLELLLFLIHSRKDVKPLAHRLLKEFDDINHVIGASSSRLRRVEGVGKATATGFTLINTICQRMLRSKLLSRPVLSSWDSLLAYCHATMAYRDKEILVGLYLDNKNVLIRDEALNHGTVNHVIAYPREIAARALELNATALIIVHNHPSGDPKPSQQDIIMTNAVEKALSALGIILHDHLIVSKTGEMSFRTEGYLK